MSTVCAKLDKTALVTVGIGKSNTGLFIIEFPASKCVFLRLFGDWIEPFGCETVDRICKYLLGQNYGFLEVHILVSK